MFTLLQPHALQYRAVGDTGSGFGLPNGFFT
jgi:hypothetical protein